MSDRQRVGEWFAFAVVVLFLAGAVALMAAAVLEVRGVPTPGETTTTEVMR